MSHVWKNKLELARNRRARRQHTRQKTVTQENSEN